MKFFLDNNLPPAWAEGLSGLSSRETPPILVQSLRGKFKANTPDHEWIRALDVEGGWCVLSQDRFGKGNPEREALRRSKLIVFRLEATWSKHGYWDKTQALVKWWPRILEQARLLEGGAVIEVPYHYRQGRFRFSTPR
ncbi:MAG: hypothetical protein AB7L76_05510 [Burkholderiaceae bacterium]